VHLVVSSFPLLNATDEAFMLSLRRGYEKEICGFWRLIALTVEEIRERKNSSTIQSNACLSLTS
jgi:hypothetical protein